MLTKNGRYVLYEYRSYKLLCVFYLNCETFKLNHYVALYFYFITLYYGLFIYLGDEIMKLLASEEGSRSKREKSTGDDDDDTSSEGEGSDTSSSGEEEMEEDENTKSLSTSMSLQVC